MLKTTIKASRISNLTDARYFAAWQASYLGFCLDPKSEYYTKPQMISAIKAWVAGPKIVGEFGVQTADEIQLAVQHLNLDMVQLNMLADEALLKQLKDIEIIKAIVIEDWDMCIDSIQYHINQYAPYVAVFVLDFDTHQLAYADMPAAVKSFLHELCQAHKILFTIALSEVALSDLLANIVPYGLNLAGGEEEKVGFKSFDELDVIFEALEEF